MNNNVKVRLRCPGCGVKLLGKPGERAACPKCKTKLQVPGEREQPPKQQEVTTNYWNKDTEPPPRRDFDFNPDTLPSESFGDSYSSNQLPHSNMGIASFIIAMLVVVANAGIALIALMHIMNTKPNQDVTIRMFSGAMSLVCLNCMSVPLCVIGALLGITAIWTGYGKCNLLTAYIGTPINAIVVIGLLALMALGSISGGQ